MCLTAGERSVTRGWRRISWVLPLAGCTLRGAGAWISGALHSEAGVRALAGTRRAEAGARSAHAAGAGGAGARRAHAGVRGRGRKGGGRGCLPPMCGDVCIKK